MKNRNFKINSKNLYSNNKKMFWKILNIMISKQMNILKIVKLHKNNKKIKINKII